MKTGIELAVDLAGGQTELAKRLGVSQQAVFKWLKQGFVPLMRAQEIEAELGIPRGDLMNPRVADLTNLKGEL